MVNITEDPQSTGPVLVGETAILICQARSIPPPTITWFRLQKAMNVKLVDNGDDITITSQSQPEDNFTTRDVLSVRVTGDEDFTRYFCVGDNGFDSSTSDVAQLVQAGMSIKIMHLQVVHTHCTPFCLIHLPPLHTPPPPSHLESLSFLEEPSNITAAIGDAISLNCTATGVPLPTIVWEDGERGNIIDDEVYNITIKEGENETVVSVLEFVAFDGVNGSQFHCVAENRADQTESELATITIGGEQKDWERCIHVWKNIIK